MIMGAEEAAPCRHAGAPPSAVVSSVSRLITDLASEESLLGRYGLTAQEYREALPAAIEGIRGSMSASVGDRRHFLATIFEGMVESGHITALEKPTYGKDTVYRLTISGYGDIAVIQKGCPDGAHSSVRWTVPDWAKETYLWWLCDSMTYEPGEHVSKGVNRLRQRFFGDTPGTVDGVIFHNHLCGRGQRPCPKAANSAVFGGIKTPPPCIYVMPDREPHTEASADEWNWNGTQQRFFPTVLLGAFGIPAEKAPAFTGHIGFQRRAGALRTTITSRYGGIRVTTSRS
ncbi:hypothetical protein NSK11_contig00144-0017 [Nocardia seriolae]|uniref:Uncharacterized protein n=2 Tax=Nocardia seriolae TaxID=37332 RepID=A0ABC9Z3I8_9NOCA|nr:hypothetical protein NS14008_06925 [Nocardia seriolae]PSK27939.1 hypothetical protein C6575_29125 [Nocardia seriolae]RLP23076.1 hypothetical protein D6158_35325 [Nocardia seriolae]GAM50199.1 hypothetical protein NS07_v2contig00141-0017 [Nocardia seriolae]GAP32175.1 hypothetical protein NSK11_contig00144-0017 [Nocardia seriolae]